MENLSSLERTKIEEAEKLLRSLKSFNCGGVNCKRCPFNLRLGFCLPSSLCEKRNG